jgi:hypothetical protein
MKVSATRLTMLHRSLMMRPVYIGSRSTVVSDVTSVAARVDGIPSPHMASEQTNSRRLERSTLRPSAVRLYGVGPAPLICSSYRPSSPTTSPIKMAAPSPSCPAKLPNWWPQ